jgi:chorismate dehydratase
MDRENLFEKSAPQKSKEHKEKKIIGISDAIQYRPLIYGLEAQSLPKNIQISKGSLNESAKKLLEGEIELALISSMDYALKKDTWHIVPGLCTTSAGQAKHVQLFFKKDLKEIQTIAIDQNVSGEDVLLKIIMREKYELTPDYIYMAAEIEPMLEKADAALIVNENALFYYNSHPNRLDLNEEWLDLTGLPFVYALWVGRDLAVSASDLSLIQSSYNLGKNNLQNIAQSYASEKNNDWIFYFDFIAKDLNYTFSEREEDGLLEFFNYAFFYGYTEYIPDLHFFKS